MLDKAGKSHTQAKYTLKPNTLKYLLQESSIAKMTLITLT